mgnify:CR=1 FL=1
MIDFRQELDFDAEGPILVMEDLCKSYQLGATELRVLQIGRASCRERV